MKSSDLGQAKKSLRGAAVLVTGGAGYIGSHVCKRLSASGYTPVAVDDLSRGHAWAVKWGPLEEVTLSDTDTLERVVDKYSPTGVIHLAGYTYVGESVERPGFYYTNNVAGSLNLLETMREKGLNRIIFSSSAAVYGLPMEVPIPEDHPKAPINPYGFSKLAVERFLEDYDRALGLRSVSLRYFNACGADSEGETGEAHDPETHLIPRVLGAALGEVPGLAIFGVDYDTPDGTCIRDYIHVTDLADAHVRALEYLLEGGPTTACNLGTGRGFSVREIIDAAEAVTGQSIAVAVAPRRAGDPSRLVSESKRAARALGWRPKHSDLPTILETAWRWMNGPTFPRGNPAQR